MLQVRRAPSRAEQAGLAPFAVACVLFLPSVGRNPGTMGRGAPFAAEPMAEPDWGGSFISAEFSEKRCRHEPAA